jgi:hypothetical protein
MMNANTNIKHNGGYTTFFVFLGCGMNFSNPCFQSNMMQYSILECQEYLYRVVSVGQRTILQRCCNHEWIQIHKIYGLVNFEITLHV